jgi:site-specific recombinase XerD
MIKYEVNVVGEMMLAKLKKEANLSNTQYYRLKTVGLGTIIRHFEKIGNMMVGKEILRDFLEKYHAEHYVNNHKAIERWKAIRRAAELLIYFSETGRVDLPILPDWTKRNCSLRIQPTAEQMAEKDNIYNLIWRTRSALRAIGYAPKTLIYYDTSGFAKILEAHIIAGCETYSEKVCAKVVLDTHVLVNRGLRHRYQGVRKAVALLDEFRRYGIITPGMLSPFEKTELTLTFASLLEEYGNDVLFSEKQSEVTVRTGKSIIKGFLLRLEECGFSSFENVTLSLVGQVVTQTAANHYKRGAESLLHYVRDFLKHLHDYNYIDIDLSVGVPKMASPRRKVYQGFTDDEIIRLLAAVDRDTPIGKRDYAMMALAAQTGLRGVDVLKLKRNDIDWRKKEINIVQSKTGAALCVTLEAESGNALCDYLLNARPESYIPTVFLRSQHPIQTINPPSAQGIVKKYMAIAGIKFEPHRRYGFHNFRRAFGTRLLESGTPIHLLSQLLGHYDLDSARPYICVSEQGLMECCLPLDFEAEMRGAQ